MAKYITPAVTPLNADGTLDVQGAKALYEHLVTGGVDGILVLGSIGEFFALSMEVKKQLIDVAVEAVNHRIPLIVGTADMVFENVLELSRYALKAGADSVIIVPPFYFWLNDASVEKYYSALAEQIDGPIYLYNFPDRTGYQLSVEVIRRLAEKYPNIVGCKDTIAGMDHTREMIKAVKPVRPDFEIYSGFDDNFAHNVLSGGDGCIAGLSNLAPEVTSAWAKAVNEGDAEGIAHGQQKIDRMMSIYGVGMPFVPFIKRAMSLRGIAVQSCATFPLPEATEADDAKLLAIMKQEGLL